MCHRKLKRIIHPTLGFKSIKTGYATIKEIKKTEEVEGIEVLRALCKGQTSFWQYAKPLEVCLANRVFGL